MGLVDRFDSIIIHDGSLDSGNWEAVDEEPVMTGDGWDGLKVTYYKMVPSITIEQAMVEFPTGMKLGTRRFWLTGFDGPRCVAAGIYRLTAVFKGLATDKPVVVSYGASAEQQSAEDVTVGLVNYDRIVNHENSVTATARYVLEDFTTAPTDSVGSASVPPQAPNVGPSFWILLENPVTHFPSGWVLMGSSSEPLAGTTVAFITDQYQFIRQQTP